ncbi:UNVERIFIED_CONTAM: Lipid phosphate phosphatase delta [Sesamum calycinum]|uniref:Lipid phosphate phosphatase delta n=1 Tax=Sesamum calycinum TaxID=2727403 RepID=A0AAW2RV48_9LAMI
METTTYFLCGIAFWILISSKLNLTLKLRSLTQPWVSHSVISGTPIILKIQKYQHSHFDAFFSLLSCVVSVPFYTAFLPLLFWDVVSAPRPSSPPVRRVTATKDEEDNAMEYGLPSSHTLNTVCLSGYLLHYVLAYTGNNDAFAEIIGFTLVSLVVGLIGLGRIYLGMHSLIDIISGLALGLGILTIWLYVSEYIDNFIVSGQNVISFWAALCFLLLFAYPTPELPTPSLNITQLSMVLPWESLLLGIPTILVVKFCTKALAKWILPIIANTLGIPIKSTSYIPALKGMAADKKSDEIKQSGYLQKLFFFSKQTSFDVDTGIRLLQYAGLAWSVVDLVPSVFSHLGL